MKKIIAIVLSVTASVMVFAASVDETQIRANIEAQTLTIDRNTVVPENYKDLFATEEIGDFNVFILEKVKSFLCEKDPDLRVITSADVKSIKVTSRNSAVAELTLKTRCSTKQQGFQDNDVECVMFFKKVNGVWKMSDNKIKHIRLL